MKNLNRFKLWARSHNIVFSIPETKDDKNYFFHLIKIHGIINSLIPQLHIFGDVHHKEYYFISIKDRKKYIDENSMKITNF